MIKRLFDLFISIILITLSSPLLACASICIFFFIGKPIFYKQLRPGLNGKPFNIIKLRTMNNIFDEFGNLLPDSERLTKLGKILRSTSIDELPALINVVLGDMSLVGPRPLLMEYLPLYNKRQFKRHLVRPGITGLAQINGRNSISWEDRFEYDIKYVENRSFYLDIKILFKTIIIVIQQKGINSSSSSTMNKFTGNSK